MASRLGWKASGLPNYFVSVQPSSTALWMRDFGWEHAGEVGAGGGGGEREKLWFERD